MTDAFVVLKVLQVILLQPLRTVILCCSDIVVVVVVVVVRPTFL